MVFHLRNPHKQKIFFSLASWCLFPFLFFLFYLFCKHTNNIHVYLWQLHQSRSVSEQVSIYYIPLQVINCEIFFSYIIVRIILFYYEMMKMLFIFYQTNTLSWIFIVLAHWTIQRVDMSLHSDTLFWFQANQSLLFFLNAPCLTEKQQIPI